LLERGMGRVHGTREESATPLVLEVLERIVHTFGTTARDDRDRALLLLGFAGAFRASELVSIRMQDVRYVSEGAVVFLRRSKEDPLAAGQEIEIGRAHDPQLCAVRALERWMGRVGKGEGPLLRRVLGERIHAKALRPRTVSRVVQYHAARLGLDGDYSSHSLRAGFATSAYARGLSLLDIQRHGRWHELRSLARYIDFEFTPYRPNPFSAIC
jgi:integrase